MSSCTATLTTATVETCDHTPRLLGTTGTERVYEFCTGGGHHIMLHTLTCNDRSLHGPEDHSWTADPDTKYGASVLWDDDTPGAKPHTDQLVTDDEVRAAVAAWTTPQEGDGAPRMVGKTSAHMRAALEAAARVRQEGG